ncbi:MAG: hypothetical protein AAFZ74_16445, partial [Pseudomonadota bacterium]
MVIIRTFCICFLVLLIGQSAFAEQLFGVVSERNSATAAAASKQFTEAYPDSEISLRTPRQLSRMSDTEIIDRISEADVFFVAGVFSEDADRLNRLIEASGKAENVYIVSSTRNLISRSRDETGARVDLEASEANALNITNASWSRANDYWQARGVDNQANLFAALLYPDQLDQILPPVPIAPVRFDEVVGPSGAPLIGIVDYDTGDQAGNADLHERLCTELVSQSAACLSVYADWGAASADALE